MALLNRKQVVSLLVESTEGTAVTPIASGGGFNTFNTSFAPDVEMYERDPFRSSLGRLASIAGVKTATVGFETEMVASTAGNVGDPASSAADYPPFHNLMLASGYEAVLVDSYTIGSLVGTFVAGETIEDDSGSEEAVCALTTKSGDTTLYVEAGGTVLSLGGTGATSEATASFSSQVSDVGILYKPSSTLPLVSYTVGVFNDGLRHRVKGCRGNVTFSASTGQPCRMAFEFVGPFEDSADITLITPTYPTRVPPSLLSAGLTVHGDTLIVDSFEVATNNELSVRRSANDAAGAISTKITKRGFTGSIDPEVELVADHDFITKLTANTEGLLDFVVAGGSGGAANRFRIQGPNCSYSGASGGERGGISTYSMDLSLNESSIGDNDFRLLCY